MVETIFTFLEQIGFSHPLHPMFTHAPMGLIIGAVVFSFLGLKWSNHLPQTASHCAILAIISIPPTILSGILDWQHRMEGEWETLIIIKMVLSLILIALLAAAIIARRKGAPQSKVFLLYFLCLACAGGLGFSGGELAYG